MTLADARERARSHRAEADEGIDPVAARQAKPSEAAADHAAPQSFVSVAEAYIKRHGASWKNAKHAAQWESTLRTFAHPFMGGLRVQDVTTAHVIHVLEPIWTSKTETATRVRSRVELVLDFATAKGLREGPNPARWRGNLEAAPPKASRVAKVEHHAAVLVADAPGFVTRLKAQSGTGARALQFLVLTAARSGEVRGLTWAELDLDSALWIVPASRMKAGREHRVPLSGAALDVLRALPRGGPDELVFPGQRGGPLSDMSLTAVMRSMRVSATAHGFRSTFRDWVSERTQHGTEVAEMALAHAVGDKVPF